MKIAEFLWGNPHQYDSEDYKKYSSLRTSRNHMMFITWLNLSNCSRDYGVGSFKWLPVWFNNVFIFATVVSFIAIFSFQYLMRKVKIDRERLQLVEKVLDE